MAIHNLLHYLRDPPVNYQGDPLKKAVPCLTKILRRYFRTRSHCFCWWFLSSITRRRRARRKIHYRILIIGRLARRPIVIT